MRHPMRLDSVWRPVLWLFGGSPGQSYVEVTGDAVRFRYGWGFDQQLPLAEIASTGRTTWSMLGGIGWRIGSGGTIGLIGTTNGVVEVRLKSPHRMRVVGIPLRCRRICVSLAEPDRFIAELRPLLRSD